MILAENVDYCTAVGALASPVMGHVLWAVRKDWGRTKRVVTLRYAPAYKKSPFLVRTAETNEYAEDAYTPSAEDAKCKDWVVSLTAEGELDTDTGVLVQNGHVTLVDSTNP